MATLNGITYKERPGSPEESYANGIGTCKRTFDVAWTQRWEFAQQMLGYSQRLNSGTGGYISRKVPEAYKDIARVAYSDIEGQFKSEYWLYAQSLDSIQGIKPIEKNANDVGTYDKARMTFTYSSLTYNVHTDDDCRNGVGAAHTRFVDANGNPSDVYREGTAARIARYITRQVQPTSEHLQLPFGQMLWADGSNTPAVNGIAKTVPGMEVIYTWHQVPSQMLNVTSQISQLYNKIGTVNKYDFDYCPPGTLLLTAIETKPYRIIGGGTVSDIVFKMKYTNHFDASGTITNKGHNHFIHFTTFVVEGGTIDPIKSYRYDLLTSNGNATTGRKVYNESDFIDLFLAL